MSPVRIIEALAVFLGVLGMIFTAFFVLEKRHAKAIIEYELQSELLELDIKKDSETRLYYQNKKDTEGDLSISDANRLRYLEEQLERKYQKKQLIDQKLLELDGDAL
jgi:hypothetical protein